MKILIVEANSSGHRLWYVRLLIDHALAAGLDVIFATTNSAIISREYALHLRPIDGRFSVHIIEGPPTPRVVNSLIRESDAGLTIIPDGDRLALLSILRVRRYSGTRVRFLVMQDPRWIPRGFNNSYLKGVLKRAVLFVGKFRSDVKLYYLRGPGYTGPFLNRVKDPVTEPAAIAEVNRFRRELGLAPDRFWFGMVGGINRWKNPQLVCEALAKMNGPEVGLAFVGTISPDIDLELRKSVALLDRRGIRVEMLNRMLSDNEMNAAVAVLDCVVLAYSTHAPPSTLGKAVACGTRVVVAGSDSFVEFANELGIEGTDLDVDSLYVEFERQTGATSPVPRSLSSTAFAEGLIDA